jgi:hypothetical protein
MNMNQTYRLPIVGPRAQNFLKSLAFILMVAATSQHDHSIHLEINSFHCAILEW